MALRTPLTAQPHLYIGDSTGRPLDYGRVYFGEPNKDPEFYPIDIYLDPEMTIAAAQPVRTKGGFMDVGGNLAELHAAEVIYSLKVLDQYGRQVFYKPEMYRNNVSDFLVDEITRATAAENLITGNLTAETQRAIAAEKVIADAVVTEKDRAIAAEGALDSKYATLDNTVAGIVNGRPTTAFATKALMTASALVDGDYAIVTDDTVDNGLYVKTAGAWVKSAYEPLMQAVANSNALFKPRALTIGEDLDNLNTGYYFIPSTVVASSLLNLPAELSNPKIALLTVFKEGGVMYQHIVHYSVTTVEEFKRVADATEVYKPWQKQIKQSDIDLAVSKQKSSLGFLIATTASIDFQHSASQLVITANKVRVIYDKSSVLLPAQTLAYPTAGVYNLVYSTDANSLSWQSTAIAPTVNQIVVGGYVTATKTVLGIDSYSVNGAPFDKIATKGDLIGNPDGINFGFSTDGLLSIAANKIRLQHNGKSYIIPARTATLPLNNDVAWYQIVYDPILSTLSFVKLSEVVTGSGVVVGYLQASSKTVVGIGNYYVDGAAVVNGGGGAEKSDLLTAELVTLNGDFTADYVQPTLPEYQTWLSLNRVHTDIYGLYDDLMSAHPDYITRTSLGLDDSGNTIYRYDFKAPAVESETQSGDLAKMIVISGVHGMEKSGIYNAYLALKEICERWQDDKRLEALRWNIHFIVVPIAVPTGFDRNTRKNINEVDIARNFPSGWVQGNPSDVTYGGTSPLSEKESQYIDALYAENTDAIYCVSHHNFGIASGSDAKFIWNASATKFGARLGKALVRDLTHKWKSQHSFISSNYDQYNGYIGISNTNSPDGSEGKHAAVAYKLNAGTFEIGNGFLGDTEGVNNTTHVATLGCEAFINWLLLNAKYGSTLATLKR